MITYRVVQYWINGSYDIVRYSAIASPVTVRSFKYILVAEIACLLFNARILHE